MRHVKGTLRERRPGHWELILQLPRDAASGRTKQLSRMHPGTEREAQRALSDLVAEVSAGQNSSSSSTLGELLTRWLEHIEDQLSPTTAREYRRLVTNMIGPERSGSVGVRPGGEGHTPLLPSHTRS